MSELFDEDFMNVDFRVALRGQGKYNHCELRQNCTVNFLIPEVFAVTKGEMI